MTNPIHIPYETEEFEEHTDTDPFCGTMTCPCHEDAENITRAGDFVSDGLMTPSEADRFYRGRTI